MSDPSDNPRFDESDVTAQRRAKLSTLREKGSVFPNQFIRGDLAGDLHEQYEDSDRDVMDLSPVVATVAGRLMQKRTIGKATVGHVQDMSGAMQVFLTDTYPGKPQHDAFKDFDIGDIIGVEGVLFKSRDQEVMLRVRKVHLLVKTLQPLPESFRRVKDREPMYRQRYLDLIMNEDSRLRFVQRSRIIQALRSSLTGKRYLEVETPIMQPIAERNAPDRFVTHHNALDVDFHLRAAPDAYLKRLMIGGFEKVFELNRCFQNTDASDATNPEVTVLKMFVAYRDHYYLMREIEKEIREAARAVLGTTTLEYHEREIDLGMPFMLLTMSDAIMKVFSDLGEKDLGCRDALRRKLSELGITHQPGDSPGALQYALFQHGVGKHLFEPTCIFYYPAEAFPLARPTDDYAGYAERFAIYIAGQQIAHGMSELSDSEALYARSTQLRAQQADDGADPDLLRAMEFGLPPAVSATIDIDRLIMVFTDCRNIKDVILFPHLPPP